ncbi:MAG: hypothetical protein ACYCW6_01685 [Candidatus Xenobia bacterium]
MSGSLGVDIGGVIISRDTDSPGPSFFRGDYLDVPAVPGVFEALRALNQGEFQDHIWLVSTCGKRIEEKTLEWLKHQDFHAITGVKPEHVRFCRMRHEKADIATEIGLTHFVDDRLEVLSYLSQAGVQNLYLFNGNSDEMMWHQAWLPKVVECSNWDDVLSLLQKTQSRPV